MQGFRGLVIHNAGASQSSADLNRVATTRPAPPIFAAARSRYGSLSTSLHMVPSPLCVSLPYLDRACPIPSTPSIHHTAHTANQGWIPPRRSVPSLPSCKLVVRPAIQTYITMSRPACMQPSYRTGMFTLLMAIFPTIPPQVFFRESSRFSCKYRRAAQSAAFSAQLPRILDFLYEKSAHSLSHPWPNVHLHSTLSRKHPIDQVAHPKCRPPTMQ
jgi:hypothetical protein